jgi:NAD-reducing hydrogenase small subunit
MKPRIATVSMAGCFGCHMSLLDIDQRLFELIELVDFDRSPIDDFKTFTTRCKIGFLEGGVANDENLHTLREFRRHCDILVSVGECACQGDIPSMRNPLALREIFETSYLGGPTTYNPKGVLPTDPELPLLLDKVYPCHEVVKIDHFLPGCPPRADAIWEMLVALLENKPIELRYDLIKYD